MTTQVWPAKDPGEIVNIAFDFTNEMSSETIVGNTVSVAVRVGIDPDSGAMLLGASQENAGVVIQQIRLGLHDVNYGFRCLAQLSNGVTLARGAVLPVRWVA